MQPRVTAVLVARNGAQYLPSTLAALAAQTRRPDSVIPVDISSTDLSPELMLKAYPSQLVRASARSSFGSAISQALGAVPQTVENEWLWLLGHDNAPEPGALSALLGAVEVAPSVAVAGPKLMKWDAPDVIERFGETMTGLGRSLPVVSGELDQAQHDIQSDMLGVSAAGMLVRRSTWVTLGGFDPALPTADAGLDLSVRARLAGHRVVGVPTARVASAGPPELFGRRSLSAGAQHRILRFAQLHRRLSYAPALSVLPHWLSLAPLALLRCLVLLVAKRPSSVGGELIAALAAAFDAGVGPARRRIRRNRVLGWGAIDPLRMSAAEVRERRAHERALASNAPVGQRTGPGFFAGGGAWIVLVAALAGLIAFGRFANAEALSGGGLLPLSATIGELWSHVGYGGRDIGAGFVGAADPFAYVLAILGSLTFWSPSLSVVLLYLAALPLAALTAWWCAARFSTRGWGPGVAALAWAAAPPLLVSLSEGQLGAVIAHILLPTLILAIVAAARSWAMTAVAALLFAVIAASAPVLVPALVLLLVAWMAARPGSIHRLVGIVIPAAALFAPLVVQQFTRANVLALAATPGRPVLVEAPSGLQLLIGSPDGSLLDWGVFATSLGLPAGVGIVAVIVTLVPLAVLALLALFLPGSRRSIPAMVIALLGFVTAVAASHIEVSSVGAATTSIWAAPALSLYWLGLVGAAVVALEVFGVSAAAPALAAGIALAVLSVPLITSAASGGIPVAESSGRVLPAVTSAQAATQPGLGTLELTAQPDGGIAATVHRGLGTTLDEQSTLDSTNTQTTEAADRLAVLAGNLASRSGFDVAAELDALQLGFVLVPDGEGIDRQRLVEALDGNRLLSPIGQTVNGFLWNYEALAEGAAPASPGPTDTTLGTAILVGQGVVFGLTLLLAVPTSRRRRVRSATGVAASSTSTGDSNE